MGQRAAVKWVREPSYRYREPQTKQVGLVLTSSGASYYRARYYDPSAGRFLNEDPIAFGGGIDFYRYVVNSPVNKIDPRGLQGHTPDQPCLSYSLDPCIPPPSPKAPSLPPGWDNKGHSGGTLGPVQPPSNNQACPLKPDDPCYKLWEADIAWCDATFGDDPIMHLGCVQIADLNWDRCSKNQPRLNPDPRHYPLRPEIS